MNVFVCFFQNLIPLTSSLSSTFCQGFFPQCRIASGFLSLSFLPPLFPNCADSLKCKCLFCSLLTNMISYEIIPLIPPMFSSEFFQSHSVFWHNWILLLLGSLSRAEEAKHSCKQKAVLTVLDPALNYTLYILFDSLRSFILSELLHWLFFSSEILPCVIPQDGVEIKYLYISLMCDCIAPGT